WFAERRPDIAGAPNAAARKRIIQTLKNEDAVLWHAWCDALRRSDGESALVRSSGRYPLCGHGDINTYAVFAETNRLLCASQGRAGCILPAGIATDDTTKYFFQALIEEHTLVSLYAFENEEHIFPDIHNATKFCLLTIRGRGHHDSGEADFAFF